MHKRSGSMLFAGLEYIGKLTPKEREYIRSLRELPEEQQKKILEDVSDKFNEINREEREKLNNK